MEAPDSSDAQDSQRSASGVDGRCEGDGRLRTVGDGPHEGAHFLCMPFVLARQPTALLLRATVYTQSCDAEVVDDAQRAAAEDLDALFRTRGITVHHIGNGRHATRG